MTLILDMGSGNTCKNDVRIVSEMITAVERRDKKKHKIILKWQLFKDVPPNVPLDFSVFDYAYKLGAKKGYETTASVFDLWSLNFLLQYKIPFVKIAGNEKFHILADLIKSVPVFLSTNKPIESKHTVLACISKYPAEIKEYEKVFPKNYLNTAISDHTLGWDLYKKYKPAILEKHFVLNRVQGNPDAGAFAVTPEDLEVFI